MKTWMLKILVMSVTAIGISGQATAQQSPTPQSVREVVVSLQDRKLALIEDGQVKKIYNVAVGKPSTPSPEGSFTIERRVATRCITTTAARSSLGPAIRSVLAGWA
jgi:hypothetical protein